MRAAAYLIILSLLSLGACREKQRSGRAERLLSRCFRIFPEVEYYHFEYYFNSTPDSSRRLLYDTLQKKLKFIETEFPSTAPGLFAAYWRHALQIHLKGRSYQPDSMREVLKSFIRQYPDDYHPYLAVAWFSLDTSITKYSSVETSAEYLDKSIEKDPKNPVLYAWSAYTEYRKDPTGLYRKSRALLKKTLDELDSTYYLSNAEYYKLLVGTKDSIKGSDELKSRIVRRCIRLDPKNSFGYRKMAEQSKNYYEKMANLDSAIKLGDREAFASKTQLLFNRNLYDDVVKFMNSVPRNIVDSTMYLKKAYSEYFTNRKSEAEVSLVAYSRSKSGSDSDFHRAYMEMGDRNFDTALDYARRQLEKDGDAFTASHHVLLINLLIMTGQRAQARQHFEQYQEKISDAAPENTAKDYGINDLLDYPMSRR